MARGYFGIVVERGKTPANIGTLWRSAHIFGASFLGIIGARYRRDPSDTTHAGLHVPLIHYKDLDDLRHHLPYECTLVGVEFEESATKIRQYVHPVRAIYLLGAEDSGLSDETKQACRHLVVLPGRFCLNVAVAGSLVMFDRVMKDG